MAVYRMATNSELQQMLALDVKTFENLAKATAHIASIKKAMDDYDKGKRDFLKTAADRKRFSDAYYSYSSIYYDLSKAYDARQKDYRNNTQYKLNSYIKNTVAATTKYFSNLWNRFSGLFGVGVAPLIPIVVGVVAVVGIISYFVNKYKTETENGYNKAASLASQLAEVNPELAEQILKGAEAVTKAKDENKLSAKLGDALKFIGITLGISGGGYLVYKIGKNEGWWEKSKTAVKRRLKK